MPQLNPDNAANDEPKTYRDEAIGGDEGHDLNDIKGDLVDEDDGEQIQQTYNDKVDVHQNDTGVHRRKRDLDREHSGDLATAGRNFPYPQQDVSALVPGLNPLFSNGFIPSSHLCDISSEIERFLRESCICSESCEIGAMLRKLASFQLELSYLIEEESSKMSMSQPPDSYHPPIDELCDYVTKRCLKVAGEESRRLRYLSSTLHWMAEVLQSQVPYSPYISPYMGSLFCGGSPPVDIDGKQVPPRPSQADLSPMYPLPGQLGQIPNPLAPWSPGPLYPLCTASAMAGMLRYPYPFASLASGPMGSVSSAFPLVPPHPHGGAIHPNMLHPGNLPFAAHINGQNGGPKSMPEKKHSGSDPGSGKRSKNSEKSNRPYVKKPLNAFMIYMKEQRAQVVAECTLKESAAINQILGRKWHSLKRDEQQKYYEMARKERQLHMQMFPGWSARDNYGKRKKRKKEKTQDCTAQNPKKCRAVFGLEQQQLWCAPCRRKKKCIRYQHDDDDSDDSDASGPCQGALDHRGFHFPNESQNLTEPSPAADRQSGEGLASERLSPGPPNYIDRVKVEKSSPLSNPAPSNATSSSSIFHISGSRTEPNNNSVNGNTGKRSTASSSQDNSTPSVVHSRTLADDHYSSANVNAKAVSADSRDRRPNSHCASPLGGGSNRQPNLFNSPMLSPGMNITSPHSSHPFLPNFSYFAAASLPTSPLSNLMGFSNFKGLPSPMTLGLKGPGSSVASGPHPGASASRHATSALEGKS